MNNEFMIRAKALGIAKGFDSGLSSVKGSEIFDLKNHVGLNYYLMYEDIYLLHELAINPKYEIVSTTDKFNVYDEILGPRGFVRKYSGTNRVVYQHTLDDSFILKIGIDEVGIDANKFEYYNQNVLKPFIPKVYDISKCGTVILMEKVEPITNKDVFLTYANEIFNVIVYLVGQGYLLEDIGTDFFMNWGIRYGFGPVLLDFPYIYRVNKSRLTCTMINMDGVRCDGHIIYDDGFNCLVCNKCGKRYAAKDIGSSFRYLNEINRKMKRREEAMDYVIKAESNVNGSFEIKNGANVIVDDKVSYTIMSKMNRESDTSQPKASDKRIEDQKPHQKETIFDKPKQPQDKFVKNDNLKIESVFKEFGLDINTISDEKPELVQYVEEAMILNANKYMKVSHMVLRTKDINELKTSGTLHNSEEHAKKLLHTNRLIVMENTLFTHYFAPNVYYDIEAVSKVVREAIQEYLEKEAEMKEMENAEDDITDEPVVKQEVEPVKEEPKDIEMKINGNALGNSTVTFKTAYDVEAVKPNTASEY